MIKTQNNTKEFIKTIGENESFEDICARIDTDFSVEDASALKLSIPVLLSKDLIFKLGDIIGNKNNVKNDTQKLIENYLNRFNRNSICRAFLTLDKSMYSYFNESFNLIAETTKNTLDKHPEYYDRTKQILSERIDRINSALYSYRKVVEEKDTDFIGYNKNIKDVYLNSFFKGERAENAINIEAKRTYIRYVENNFKKYNRKLKSSFFNNNKVR